MQRIGALNQGRIMTYLQDEVILAKINSSEKDVKHMFTEGYKD